MSFGVSDMPAPTPTPFGDAVRRDSTASEMLDVPLKKKMAEVAEGIQKRTSAGMDAVRILESRIGAQRIH